MHQTKYRIKLYGHSSADPDFFLVELAAVLETEMEAARSLLKSAPVVIKEGISLEEAEHLQGLLRLIKALSIVEPTEEIAEPPAQSSPSPTEHFDDLKQELREKEQKEALRSYAWLGAAALGATVILVWLVYAFFSSYSRSSLENQTKKPIAAPEVRVPPSSAQPPPLAANLQELYRQMESADSGLQSLEFQMRLAEQELHRLSSTYKPDQNLIREKKVEVADFKQRVRAARAAFKALKSQADAIEATLKQSSN